MGHTTELHSLHTPALHEKHEVQALRSLLQSQKLQWPCFISCCMLHVWRVNFLLCEYGSLCTHDVWRVSSILCEYGSLCAHDVRCVSFLLCEYGSLCTHDVQFVCVLLCEYGSLFTHDVRCVSFLLCEYGSLCTHDVWPRLSFAMLHLLRCFPTNKRKSRRK